MQSLSPWSGAEQPLGLLFDETFVLVECRDDMVGYAVTCGQVYCPERLKAGKGMGGIPGKHLYGFYTLPLQVAIATAGCLTQPNHPSSFDCSSCEGSDDVEKVEEVWHASHSL